MSTTFPNELMDRIIDHFYDDPKTLSACGLVCLGWIPSVRYHRFQDVQLEKDAIPAFHSLLKASPAVASYVGSISIDYYCHAIRGTAMLCDILSSLPKLRALSLCFMTVGSAQARDLFSALPKSLERLRMVQVIFSTVGDLIFLWSQLPRLRSFVAVPMMAFGATKIPEEYAARRDTRLLHATDLQMAWFIQCFDVLVDWLCAQNVPAQLRACSACVSKPQDVAPAVRLLREFGPALECLELCMTTPGMEAIRASDALYACDLAQCTGLKELHFAVLLNGSSNADMFLCMARFLSQVRAPGITAVVFSFAGGVPGGRLGDKPVTHLDSLATALAHNGAFGDVERVVVRLSEGLGRVEERAYALIRGALQWVEDRGLLTIEVNEEEDEEKKWVY
ncbi:hypothetical protein V8D89_001086 [Ganoderma adspersum]